MKSAVIPFLLVVGGTLVMIVEMIPEESCVKTDLQTQMPTSKRQFSSI